MDQFTWKISKCQSHSQGIETGISDDELKCPHDRQVEEMKGGIWFGDADADADDDDDDDDDDPSESDVMQGACPRKTSHHCTSLVA